MKAKNVFDLRQTRCLDGVKIYYIYAGEISNAKLSAWDELCLIALRTDCRFDTKISIMVRVSVLSLRHAGIADYALPP